MRKKILLPSISLCLLTLLFSSCIKQKHEPSITELCNQLGQLHAHPFTPVLKGEQIIISADNMEGANYYWVGPNNFQSYSQDNTVSGYADYFNRGWYYVNISYDQCESKHDSVYVDVKFPQGTPACSPADNNATFNSAMLLGDQSFYFVSFGPATGGYGITANSMNGDMNITMSGYWTDHDLEDGIYYTSSSPIPEYYEIDKIHISDVNQSIYWTAEPDKPVYISHVGGKQRITFCGIDFSGDWGGTLYHATVDAQITQP
ncbi:MAG: hypothetical protein QM737_12975 [Ferruginibacter sp.]